MTPSEIAGECCSYASSVVRCVRVGLALASASKHPRGRSRSLFYDPLANLGDGIEVRVQPAPGDRGTEIHARVRGSVPSGASGVRARISGEDPRQALRRALRETQWLLETGEVLSPDTKPTTKPTPGGKLLGTATGRSWEEGRL